MKICLIGDMHGDVDFVHKILQYEKPEFALQIGDYIAYNESWEYPVGWISGNWDKIEVINALENDEIKLPSNNFYLKAAELYTINNKTILTLPTFRSNNTQHRGPAVVLLNHINKCLKYVGQDIDFFISHGCGYPFVAKTLFGTKNVESKEITDLINKLQPKYAISGHIHQHGYLEQNDIKFYRMGFKETCILNI